MPKAKHYGRGAPARPSRVEKGLVTGEFEGGAHWHRLDRAQGMTQTDGAHRHIFMLPDGQMVMSAEDGMHRHDLDGDMGYDSVYGGAHVHAVTLPSGETVQTEVAGHHHHGLQIESTTLDGLHQHMIVLPDGTTIESMTVADFVERGGSIAPSMGDVEASRGDVYMRFGKRAQLDISIGRKRWLLDVGRHEFDETPSVDEATELAAAYDIEASPHFVAFEDAACKAEHDLDRPYHGQTDEAGRVCVKLAEGVEFERGVDGEYFTAGGLLRGQLVFGESAATCKREGFPFVLQGSRGQEPPTHPALPRPMADQVPEALRWWATKGDEASIRYWTLLELGLFKADEVMLTPSGIAKVHVERTFYAFEPDPVLDLPDIVKVVLPAGPVSSPMAADDWRAEVAKATETILFFDVADDLDRLESVVFELGKCAAPYLVVADDSWESRDLLSKLAAPSKHPGGAWGQVFATNLPTPLVPVQRRDEVLKPFAGFEDFDDCVSSQMEDGKDEEAARNICGSLQAEFEKQAEEVIEKCAKWIVAKQEDEERFILGIVAEPDEIDTQQDTIQAGTIREAAHKFMEDFRNIGLQHQTFVNGRVKILESHVTLVDQEIGGEVVKAGSWILGVRVIDDRIWKAVKDGTFTGFSLGGTAIREPLA